MNKTIFFLDYGITSIEGLFRGKVDESELTAVAINDLSEATGDTFSAAVLVSRMNEGFAARHADLICAYPNIRRWFILITEKKNQAEEDQIVIDCKRVFSVSGKSFELINGWDPNEDPAGKIFKPAREFPLLCLYAAEREILERAAQIFKEGLSRWEIKSCRAVNELKDADAVILIANSETEAGLLMPPKDHIIHQFVWIETPVPIQYDQISDRKKQTMNALNRMGWALTDTVHTLFSSMQHEEAAAQLKSGDITFIGLRDDPDFIIWDRYGMPLPVEEYSESTVSEFLREHTVFPQVMLLLSRLYSE